MMDVDETYNRRLLPHWFPQFQPLPIIPRSLLCGKQSEFFNKMHKANMTVIAKVGKLDISIKHKEEIMDYLGRMKDCAVPFYSHMAFPERLIEDWKWENYAWCPCQLRNQPLTCVKISRLSPKCHILQIISLLL